MKKIFAYLTLAVAVLFGSVTVANAQSKELKKDSKKMVKQLKKDGWELMGATSTLDYAVLKYRTYMEEDEENRIAITGFAAGKNDRAAVKNAVNDGITTYATRASANVVGSLKSIVSTDASNLEAVQEIDKFGAAYKSSVNTKIQGLVKQHFVLKRKNSQGNWEITVYMSIDEAAAKKAREEAAIEAKRQAQLEGLSEQVDEFISEPVSVE